MLYVVWGPLRHKVSIGSQIIFTNSAEAGRNYNGITELEINDMLSDENDTIFDAEVEVSYSKS